jgi:hypothetical protein
VSVLVSLGFELGCILVQGYAVGVKRLTAKTQWIALLRIKLLFGTVRKKGF